MRHAHLFLAPAAISAARELIPFRVLLDDEAPGLSAGVDIDQDGNGTLPYGRLHQLVREHDASGRCKSRSAHPAPRRRVHVRIAPGVRMMLLVLRMRTCRSPLPATTTGRGADDRAVAHPDFADRSRRTATQSARGYDGMSTTSMTPVDMSHRNGQIPITQLGVTGRAVERNK